MQKKDTSWEDVAVWYDEHLSGRDTYHEKVILPNLFRLANIRPKDRVLDLACGQGFFTRKLAEIASFVVGTDLSPSLIALARKDGVRTNMRYDVADASKLRFAKNGEFDVVICVLALQNMEHLTETLKEVRRVLAPTGRFIFVLNHPAFRIPHRSSWGFDEKLKLQYRRIERYLSGSKEKIVAHPGKAKSDHTWSFHRSLQDYMKALRNADLSITSLEEWISHRKSQAGPRAKAEDIARKEFPLFLAIEARPLR